MKKIGDITNTADKNGEFTNGNVAAGTPPTTLEAPWFNSVQREILNVLVKAGIPQSATKEDQLAVAIEKLIGSAGYLPTGYSYSKVESNLKFQPIGNYQPSGDYVTTMALNNGLDKKFDKTGGVITGQTEFKHTNLKINGKDDWTSLILQKSDGSYIRIETTTTTSTSMLTLYSIDVNGKLLSSVNVPNKSGSLAMYNDVSLSAVPVGGSIFWNTSTPIPANYWANEGRSFSEKEFPDAAKIFPDLKLPDDRGYGLRVADNGRGIDAGRTVGTYQDDTIQDMAGNITISSEITPSSSANGIFKLGSKTGYSVTTQFVSRPIHEVTLDISTQVRTSSETRMKNVSKILITRMK